MKRRVGSRSDRAPLAGLLAALLGTLPLLLSFSGFDGPPAGTPALSAGSAALAAAAQPAVFREEGDTAILENAQVRLSLSRTTGAILTVENRVTGVRHKEASAGSWPFSLATESGGTVRLGPDTPSRATGWTSVRRGSTIEVTYRYEDLLDQSARPTGIRVSVRLSLGDGSESASLWVDLDNRDGTSNITRLTLCDGGDLKAGDPAAKLVAPAWGGGRYWTNPLDNPDFRKGIRLGYPGRDNETLESGWMDFSSESGGIGIGYLNRRGLAMDFVLKAGSDGLSVSPTLFQPFRTVANLTVPLRRGESFSGDEVLIVAHQGDWHTMADVYRDAYRRTFVMPDGTPDYLSWDRVSPKIRDTDAMIRYINADYGVPSLTFDGIYDRSVGFLNLVLGTETPDASHWLFWLTGQNENGYAFDVPIMVPATTSSGGTEALRRLDRNLQAMGFTIYHYQHPFAVDPAGEGYIPSSDPGQATGYWNGCTHHSVCIDNQPVRTLWIDRVLPDMRSMSIDGLLFDQAPLQQTVCDLSDHEHGLSAEERLTSHAQALVWLSKKARTIIDPEGQGFLVSEGYHDVLARYIDAAQSCWHHWPIYGSRFLPEVRQYSLPWVVNHYNPAMEPDGKFEENTVLLAGILGGSVGLNDHWSTTYEIRREFITLRNSLRTARAPGFPQGFRDTIGLKVSQPGLVAKVFVDGSRATVTYYAKTDVRNATVTVDLDRLGVGGGTRTFSVSLGANRAGFRVLDKARTTVVPDVMEMGAMLAPGCWTQSAEQLATQEIRTVRMNAVGSQSMAYLRSDLRSVAWSLRLKMSSPGDPANPPVILLRDTKPGAAILADPDRDAYGIRLGADRVDLLRIHEGSVGVLSSGSKGIPAGLFHSLVVEAVDESGGVRIRVRLGGTTLAEALDTGSVLPGNGSLGVWARNTTLWLAASDDPSPLVTPTESPSPTPSSPASPSAIPSAYPSATSIVTPTESLTQSPTDGTESTPTPMEGTPAATPTGGGQPTPSISPGEGPSPSDSIPTWTWVLAGILLCLSLTLAGYAVLRLLDSNRGNKDNPDGPSEATT